MLNTKRLPTFALQKQTLITNITMAIDKKSKMGSMMGMPNLNAIAETPAPTVQEEKPKKSAPKKSEPAPEPPTSSNPQPSTEEPKKNLGGRPRFDIVEGKEMKMSFHCPVPLYRAIIRAAANEMKTNKQLLCEILFDALTTKYGQIIVAEPNAE